MAPFEAISSYYESMVLCFLRTFLVVGATVLDPGEGKHRDITYTVLFLAGAVRGFFSLRRPALIRRYFYRVAAVPSWAGVLRSSVSADYTGMWGDPCCIW
jgi:hypothetical protein